MKPKWEAVYSTVYKHTTTKPKQSRKEIIKEIEGIVGEDESIDDVHRFWNCEVVSEHECPKCHRKPCQDYDYTGGLVNGRNQLRKEIRERLLCLK